MPNEQRHYSNELNLESVGINLPYNMQAEQSVLGAVLLKPDTLTDLVEIIKPEMFYTRQNAQIWTEMLRLFTNDQTIDFVTLLDAVVSDGVFPSADEAKIYLTGLAETVPSISNVKAYAQIVQEKYLVRQLMGVAKDILQDAGDEPDADLLLENAEQRIYEIRSGRDSSALTPLSSSMVETLTNLQKISGPDADKYKGIPTGFRLLDTVLTGLGRGDLVILAARPGMGKTSFALNIATRVAMQQKVPVAIFSLEMTKEQLTNRILSSEAGIDSQAFRTGALRAEDWEYLALATEKLHDAPIYMDDTSGITITEMKAKIRRVNQDPARPNVGLIVIDYLQLMTTGQRSENRVQEISSITRNLKIMAKEMNVPIIALSQLSRARSFRICATPAPSSRMRTAFCFCTAIPTTPARTRTAPRWMPIPPSASWQRTVTARPAPCRWAGTVPTPALWMWTSSADGYRNSCPGRGFLYPGGAFAARRTAASGGGSLRRRGQHGAAALAAAAAAEVRLYAFRLPCKPRSARAERRPGRGLCAGRMRPLGRAAAGVPCSGTCSAPGARRGGLGAPSALHGLCAAKRAGDRCHRHGPYCK